ncbi:discoidin domain-containing protein [Cohnella zeiphila]|uniref:Discoidin domain-containing protein n=1 Tax=Cohnella zeiphila TaxID=2761120 RepID=A0A7X0SQQ8_9BACL|nr:discoidin domain-containing protein [Cohnella zeiphila]MBB6734405.1 discoidin domain-containing protein [Cohnella zeiphila]
MQQKRWRRAIGQYLICVLTVVALLLSIFPVAFADAAKEDVNLSLGQTATASSVQDAAHNVEMAIDGNSSTRWAANGSSKPQWLQVDLGASRRISEVETSFEFTDSYYQYKIETSNDGSAWTTFADRTGNTALAKGEYRDTGSALGRYVRIAVTGTQDAGMWASIKEFRIAPFEQEDVVNAALGKAVSASSAQDSAHAPEMAVDGDSAMTRWAANGSSKPQWLQVDLGQSYRIVGTQTFFEFDDSYYQYKVEVSQDQSTWTTLADRTSNTVLGAPFYDDRGGVTGRYVRITVTGQQNASVWASIKEFKVLATLNLAQGKPATSSSNQDVAYGPDRAVDGDSVGTRWAANGSSKPQWLQIDLGQPLAIARIETAFEFTDSYYQYKIEVSDNGSQWHLFADRTTNTELANPAYTDLGSQTGRFVRITVTGTQSSGMWASIYEFKVFGPESPTLSTNQLISGDYRLKTETVAPNRYGIGIYRSNGERVYGQSMPQSVLIKDSMGNMRAYESAYTSAAWTGGGLTLSGTVTTDNGSQIGFQDVYTATAAGGGEGSFVVSRTATVLRADSRDEGFNTKFSLTPAAPESIMQYDMLAPGVWYKQNADAVAGALGKGFDDDYDYIREMRLTLPFFMMQNRNSGDIASLGHINAEDASGVTEKTSEWLVDGSIQFGSLGVHKGTQPSLDFVYPGMEGEKSYLGGGWTRRSHPVQAGFSHQYQLALRFTSGTDYNEAMKNHWRYYYGLYNPQVQAVSVPSVYNNAIELLDTYSRDYNGVIGLPFKAAIPNGQVTGNGMVMGFVGQQLPAAYQMIRYGLQNNDSGILNKGSAMVDFWVNHSMTPSGLPKIWYEPYESGGSFRPNDVDLRTVSDGMEGVVDAYRVMEENGQTKTAWLNYAQTFGDWLVANQNADGSYYRIYNQAGNPVHTGKFNTTNPIRFLIKLYRVTNDMDYLNAAVAAGDYAYDHVYETTQYVGGTSDNNNTIDKEAGALAINAFLALYDATKTAKWLTAAQGAAAYTETWTYAWNYEITPGGTRWAAAGDAKPQWLQVDLGQTTAIEKVETYFEFPNNIYQYKIEVSNDGTNWTLFKDRTSNSAAGSPSYEDTGSANARYVRLTVTGTESPGDWVSVWELKVYRSSDHTNIAVGKPTTASTYDSDRNAPSKATDGSVDTNDYSPFPASGLVGQSLVATGHSYTDMYMAYMGAAYYRLYLYTDDEHDLNMARILQNNANRTTDWNGTLGYAYPGLVEEGGDVTEFKYDGIGVWLTWCTVAQLEPLSLLEDRFGSMSIDEIEQLPLQTRKQLNEEF